MKVRGNKSDRCASVDINFDKLAEFLRQDARVVGATVFGSARDGRVHSGSDLDLAVLFHASLPADEFLEFYSQLCEQVPDVEQIDLVRLNQADPILAFEALNGKVICTNNAEKMAGYFSLVCREYEDVMGNLEHQRQLAS